MEMDVCSCDDSFEVGDRVLILDDSELRDTEGTIVEIQGCALVIQADLCECLICLSVMEVVPA